MTPDLLELSAFLLSMVALVALLTLRLLRLLARASATWRARWGVYHPADGYVYYDPPAHDGRRPRGRGWEEVPPA